MHMSFLWFRVCITRHFELGEKSGHEEQQGWCQSEGHLCRVYSDFPCMMDNRKELPHMESENCTEAEFFDVIGTKVFRVFLLAIHIHLY
jgi:hypothetical protein